MKKVFKNLQTLLIVVLIIVIILLRNCSGSKNTPQPKPEVIVRIDTTWVPVTSTITEYVPQWNDRIEYRPSDTVYIDTNKILDDYYAQYYYVDTLGNDSITIIIKDTITQNQITSRRLDLEILYPRITTTRDSVINKREFYVGLGVGGNRNELSYVGFEALYRSKKKIAFGIGLGVNQEFKPTLMGKFYWKLGK